jgi:hypothetical protein
MDCPSCGTPAVHPDQRFCAKCGTNLPGASSAAPETVAAVEPPPAYGRPPRITGPLFADDASPGQPIAPPPPPGVAPPPPGPFPPQPMVEVPYPYPSPPPPPPPAPYDDARQRWRRASIVLLVVAAVFAALIGATGVVLLFGGDDDPGSDTAADTRDAKVPTTKAGGTTGATESATETETDEPATFRCWNGGVAVVRLETCPPPSGADGMSWVFPSSTGTTCTSDAGVQRASEVECAPVVGGDGVRFHYSEWRSRAALETYYGNKTIVGIGTPDGRGDLTAVQVESRDPDVGYKVAIYYTDSSGLWSVTIYSADEAQYQAALDEFEGRPFRQLRGKPTR